jgi:hypothetical protein
MSIRTRITRTAAVLAIAGTSALALAPAVSAAPNGPGDLAPCQVNCGGGGGDNGLGGADDFTSNPHVDPPTPTPNPTPEPQPDTVIVVSHPTFTG